MGFCSYCGGSVAGGTHCVACGTILPPESHTASQYVGFPAGQAVFAPTYTLQYSGTLSALAMVFGGISVFFYPIFFGLAGIVLAFIGKSRGEPSANLAVAVSIGGTMVGFLLTFLVTASFYQS